MPARVATATFFNSDAPIVCKGFSHPSMIHAAISMYKYQVAVGNAVHAVADLSR